MVRITFVFADGPQNREFKSTFDAYCEILNAFNQCEEYFVGARLADDKEGWINILDAEAYVAQVAPVKEYLEIACLSGFEDYQIREDIKQMFFMDVPKILSSWRQYMKEYVEGYEEYLKACEDAETPDSL